MSKKSQPSELELIEARLRYELKAKSGQVKKSGKTLADRPVRFFINVRYSCKKADPAKAPVIVECDIETISEDIAHMEALKAAKGMGFSPKECILLSLDRYER
jgi:hypothetical protein